MGRQGGSGCGSFPATRSTGIAYPGSGDDAHDGSDESEFDRTFLVFVTPNDTRSEDLKNGELCRFEVIASGITLRPVSSSLYTCIS